MSDNEALVADSSNEDFGIDTTSPNAVIGLFQGLGKVLNYVGIAGFIVLSAVIYIYFFTDTNQKSEFFDTWFLFKTGSAPFCITVMVLVIFLITQQIHYTRVIKAMDERITELATKKKSKYAEALRMKLSSSVKAKKK